MSNAVRLVVGDREIVPSLLECRILPLAASEAARYRTEAYANGRVYEREGLAIFAFGEAARLELPDGLAKQAPRDAQGLLDEISVVIAGDLGPRVPHGALALGALAFSPSAPSSLCLPSTTVVVADGTAAAILVAETGKSLQLLEPGNLLELAPDSRAPDGFELVSARPHEEFLALVERAIVEIGQGELDKVVVAREVTITANRPFVQAELVERLRALYPSCATFALDGFVGASPELLCRRIGERVEAHPLAGTIARSGDPVDDARRATAFFADDKERREHAIVVDAIAAALGRFTDELEVPSTPSLLELRNVSHLGTAISGHQRAGATEGILDLVADLHPTPAVAGWPRDPALAFLARHEGLERDRYAGPVGYVCGGGDGEFYLGIRSALIDGATARLIAGVGIVSGSRPDAELAETQLKLQALLAAAVRP